MVLKLAQVGDGVGRMGQGGEEWGGDQGGEGRNGSMPAAEALQILYLPPQADPSSWVSSSKIASAGPSKPITISEAYPWRREQMWLHQGWGELDRIVLLV